MTTKKTETKTTKAKKTATKKPSVKTAAAKKATVRKKAAAKKATTNTTIKKFQEREKVAKEKLQKWLNRFNDFLLRKDWKMKVLYALIIVFLVAGTIQYFEARFNENMAELRHEKMIEDQIRAKTDAEMKNQYLSEKARAERAERAQVVSYTTDGFTVIHNAKEDKFPVEYRNRLSEWAKAEGFDGIVFGRIQPLFGGGIKYATYSGMNEVPMHYVVDELRENQCSNVISVMSNKTEFHLPYPFSYQTNGDFKIWQTKGISAAGFFNFIDPKIKFRADNFEGTLNDGELSVTLKDHKPWEAPTPKNNKKH